MTNPASEYEALAHVVDRLARHFPGVDEGFIRSLVAEAVADFDQPSLRIHIPVLVEGAVRRHLRESAKSSHSLTA